MYLLDDRPTQRFIRDHLIDPDALSHVVVAKLKLIEAWRLC
jgi:hypothetical protein